MVFRMPILANHERHRIISEAVNKDLEGFAGTNRESAFDQRFSAASKMIERFSIEFDTDAEAARLIDSKTTRAAYKFGPGELLVATDGAGTVYLQLPTDIPIATTGYFGFTPAEARSLAALLVKKADEAHLQQT